MTGGINWLDSIAKQHFRSILHQPPLFADKAAEAVCIRERAESKPGSSHMVGSACTQGS